MPRFLNTLGRATLGVGICDRCHFKASIEDLVPDGNIPGLRVHQHCSDDFDPYRLPALQDDRVVLPFVRPDEPLTVSSTSATSSYGVMPPTGTLTLAGRSPSISTAALVPGVGALNLVGVSAVVTQQRTLRPSVGTLNLTGIAPTVTVASVLSGLLVPLSPATVSVPSYGPVAVHPTGNFLYSTNFGSASVNQFAIAGNGQLSALSPATVAVGSIPGYVVVTPNGNFAYVANIAGNTISQFSVGVDGKLTALSPATVSAVSGVTGLAMHPSGNYLYSSGSTNVFQFSIGIDGKLSPLSPATVVSGINTQEIIVHPSGLYAYVSEGNSNVIRQFSIASGLLSPLSPATVATTGSSAQSMGISPDGLYFYVVNISTPSITQYSISSGALTVLSPSTVTPGSTGIAELIVSPDSKHVYFAANPLLQYSINTSAGALTPLVPPDVGSGSGKYGIGITPNGLFVYVTNNVSNVIHQYSRT